MSLQDEEEERGKGEFGREADKCSASVIISFFELDFVGKPSGALKYEVEGEAAEGFPSIRSTSRLAFAAVAAAAAAAKLSGGFLYIVLRLHLKRLSPATPPLSFFSFSITPT